MNDDERGGAAGAGRSDTRSGTTAGQGYRETGNFSGDANGGSAASGAGDDSSIGWPGGEAPTTTGDASDQGEAGDGAGTTHGTV